ncbi:MAG: MarR family transcriptional regulator [Sphingobacteriaceae bacterium]|jgi:DNA-binding MarR family transcriptional regulator|nr:MAG: MarR family transcriptional regulator [Pedobacter sp.]
MQSKETIDYFLKIAWQRIANNYNQIGAEFELTQATGYMLINIDKEGTAVSQIASLLGLKSTSLSRMLNNMEKLGLIYRRAAPHDKRSVKIFLTELGKKKRRIAKEVIQEFNEYLNVHINSNERLQLINTLKKINQLTLAYKPKKQ